MDKKEGKESKNTNNSKCSPIKKGDYVVKEIQMISVDTMKELYYMCDNDDTDTTGEDNEGKITKKLKLKAVKTMYTCRLCNYSTMNRAFLPLHKCSKNNQNNDTNRTQNVNDDNMHISNDNKTTNENNNHIIKNLKTVKTNKNFKNSKMRVTNDNMQISNDKTYIKVQKDALGIQEISKTNIHVTNKNDIIKDLSEADRTDAFDCTICKFPCRNLMTYNMHMDSHYNCKNSLKCSKCSYFGKNMVDLKRHYDDAFNEKCHCGYDLHKKNRNVPHKNIHSVTMIVLPDFF